MAAEDGTATVQAQELVTRPAPLRVVFGTHEHTVIDARFNRISGRVMVRYADGGEDDYPARCQIQLRLTE